MTLEIKPEILKCGIGGQQKKRADVKKLNEPRNELVFEVLLQ